MYLASKWIFGFEFVCSTNIIVSVVCGCIHDCTLGVLRDILVANSECTYIVMPCMHVR